jgi:hypothetical protein
MTRLTPEEMATLNQALAVAESEYRRCENSLWTTGSSQMELWRQRAIDAHQLRKKICDGVLAQL